MKGGKKGPAQISGEGKRGQPRRFQEREEGASTDFRRRKKGLAQISGIVFSYFANPQQQKKSN